MSYNIVKACRNNRLDYLKQVYEKSEGIRHVIRERVDNLIMIALRSDNLEVASWLVEHGNPYKIDFELILPSLCLTYLTGSNSKLNCFVRSIVIVCIQYGRIEVLKQLGSMYESLIPKDLALIDFSVNWIMTSDHQALMWYFDRCEVKPDHILENYDINTIIKNILLNDDYEKLAKIFGITREMIIDRHLCDELMMILIENGSSKSKFVWFATTFNLKNSNFNHTDQYLDYAFSFCSHDALMWIIQFFELVKEDIAKDDYYRLRKVYLRGMVRTTVALVTMFDITFDDIANKNQMLYLLQKIDLDKQILNRRRIELDDNFGFESDDASDFDYGSDDVHHKFDILNFCSVS